MISVSIISHGHGTMVEALVAELLACPEISVEHDARRVSHRNLLHMGLHLASLLRYFLKHCHRLPSLPTP